MLVVVVLPMKVLRGMINRAQAAYLGSCWLETHPDGQCWSNHPGTMPSNAFPVCPVGAVKASRVAAACPVQASAARRLTLLKVAEDCLLFGGIVVAVQVSEVC